MSYEPEHTHHREAPEPSTGWTGFAVVKYGFIFLITVAVLYFLAVYVIPAFGD